MWNEACQRPEHAELLRRAGRWLRPVPARSIAAPPEERASLWARLKGAAADVYLLARQTAGLVATDDESFRRFCARMDQECWGTARFLFEARSAGAVTDAGCESIFAEAVRRGARLGFPTWREAREAMAAALEARRAPPAT